MLLLLLCKSNICSSSYANQTRRAKSLASKIVLAEDESETSVLESGAALGYVYYVGDDSILLFFLRSTVHDGQSDTKPDVKPVDGKRKPKKPPAMETKAKRNRILDVITQIHSQNKEHSERALKSHEESNNLLRLFLERAFPAAIPPKNN